MVITHYDTANGGRTCIIGGVKRIGLAVVALLLAACGQKNIENKEAIRQAVIDYLMSRQAQTGLDMSTMDVNVTAMAFERDTARATVEFRVKNSDAGMQLNYTLDRKGDKWVVQARQDSGQGHGVVLPEGGAPGNPGSTQLPPGHPAIPATPSTSPQPASPKQ
jgi:hypothetical protein